MLRLGVHLGLSDVVRALADRDGRVRGKRGHAPRQRIRKRKRRRSRAQSATPKTAHAARPEPTKREEILTSQQKNCLLTKTPINPALPSHLLDRHGAARQRDGARACDLDDAVLRKHLGQSVDLVALARQLNDDILLAHVDDARAEDVDDVDDVGAPVLPGAMFLLSYTDDNRPVAGLPGCVMYAKRTIFDLVLPYLMAGVPVSAADLARMGEGGLCMDCPVCTFPNGGFGK